MAQIDTKERVDHELTHGKKLASEGAEAIWNWASPGGQKRAERRAELIVKTGHIVSTDRVLEIGCGTGLFTKKVSEITGAKIVATDISEELLALARKEFPAGDFRIGDAMKLPFHTGEFDVVFGSSILHHLDFNKTLTEILRVLKPGGRMIFAEPNMLNPQILVQKNVPAIKKALGDSPDETAIVRWNFSKLLQSIGYVKVDIFPYDFLHPYTPKPLVGFVNGLSKVLEHIPLIKEIAGSVIIYAEKPKK